MDLAFEDVQNADEKGKCKEGLQLCPDNVASASNKICLPKNKLGGSCPVTAFKFQKKQVTNEVGFDYVDFNQDFKIAFSRLQDSYPLSSFEVSTHIPCHSSISTSWDSNDFDNTRYGNEYKEENL